MREYLVGNAELPEIERLSIRKAEDNSKRKGENNIESGQNADGNGVEIMCEQYGPIEKHRRLTELDDCSSSRFSQQLSIQTSKCDFLVTHLVFRECSDNSSDKWYFFQVQAHKI